MLGLLRHFLWVTLRILVINELSLEETVREQVVYKWNEIFLISVTKLT